MLESVNNFMNHMAQGLEEAKVPLPRLRWLYNHQCEPVPIFTPGNKVWLVGSNITTNQLSSKLSHWQLGPFTVEACVGHGAYCLTLPPHFDALGSEFPNLRICCPPNGGDSKPWNKSKESLIPRSKTKQVRVSPKVPPNNQESINVYQCYMQRVYNRLRISTIQELSIQKQSLK
jgi:hypothetical protein